MSADTTAPVAPAAPALAASSDSGMQDGVTNDSTPTFSGGAAGETGGVANVFANAVLLGSAPILDGGWTFTPATALSDGTYNVTVRIQDRAGLVSPASAAISIVIG